MSKVVQMPDENDLPDEVEEDIDIEAILNTPEESVDDLEVKQTEDIEEQDTEEETSVSIEDLPDDAELWPGGPLIGQIKEWKQEHGEDSVYVTSITFNKHIVWRTMTRPEYRTHIRNMEKLQESGQLTQASAGLYNEEAVAELCILYPQYDRKNSPKEMAGMPSIIAQEVMEASGFVALEVRQL